MKSITELKDIHKDEDIWIIASGASMNHIDKSFFDNKITIGVSSVWKFFRSDYVVEKHGFRVEEAAKNNQVVVYPEHDYGCISKRTLGMLDDKHFMYSHKRWDNMNHDESFKIGLDSIGKDNDLITSSSIITTAIHLAAYMGAKNIIICGHDCGYIDKEAHITNYHPDIRSYWKTDKKFNEYYNKWYALRELETRELKKKLNEVYDCNICSLNPFINFILEGHEFKKENK